MFRIAIVFALLSATLLVARQQTPPTFRAGVEVVPVYATVTDRGGRFVLDLAKSDFAVTDNG